MWLCVSGRQRVDTQGVVNNKESQSPSTISPRAGGQCVSKTGSMSFVVHSAKDGSTLKGIITVRHRPPCVYQT